jgi:hypothetical protein
MSSKSATYQCLAPDIVADLLQFWGCSELEGSHCEAREALLEKSDARPEGAIWRWVFNFFAG